MMSAVLKNKLPCLRQLEPWGRPRAFFLDAPAMEKGWRGNPAGGEVVGGDGFGLDEFDVLWEGMIRSVREVCLIGLSAEFVPLTREDALPANRFDAESRSPRCRRTGR